MANWTESELDRCGRVKGGECVVANKHHDRALLDWAERTGRAVHITRPGMWENPFPLPPQHTAQQRDGVIELFRCEHLPAHPELVERAKVQLREKVLFCVCHPKPCHGDVLAKIANDEKKRPLSAPEYFQLMW